MPFVRQESGINRGFKPQGFIVCSSLLQQSQLSLAKVRACIPKYFRGCILKVSIVEQSSHRFYDC